MQRVTAQRAVPTDERIMRSINIEHSYFNETWMRDTSSNHRSQTIRFIRRETLRCVRNLDSCRNQIIISSLISITYYILLLSFQLCIQCGFFGWKNLILPINRLIFILLLCSLFHLNDSFNSFKVIIRLKLYNTGHNYNRSHLNWNKITIFTRRIITQYQ